MLTNFGLDIQTFIENSDDMVGIFDPEFKLIAFNQKLANTFFKSDLIRLKAGKNFASLLPPDKKSFWQDQFTLALKGETAKSEFPYEGTTGQFYYMENAYKPVVHNDEVVYVIQILKVITLRKKFEEKIQWSERTYRHLASNIPNSDLFLLDNHFNIIVASGTDLRSKGYEVEKFVGRNMYDVAEQFGLTLLWEYYDRARNGIDSQVEFVFDGDDYLDDIIPLRDETNQVNGYIIFSRKVTQQKQNEKKLESLNRSKDNILGIVAHDLRNPITAILGLADLIKNDVHNADKYFDLINRSCKTALNIISELLDISELDRPDFKLKTEPVELISYLKGIVHTNNVLAAEKELDFDFKTNINQLSIELNPGKFSRVINNLLVNAIKFSHRKEKIRMEVNFVPSESNVIIKVQDHGIGIPDALKSIIFDKFTKAGRKGTEGEKSLGLGMSIVKRIVELHQGKIWLESRENEGTTVFIQLAVPDQGTIQNAGA